MENIQDMFNSLWHKWKNDELTFNEMIEKIKSLFVEDMGFANLDIDRKRRRGFPEAIMAEGKILVDLKKIIGKLFDRNEEIVLITKVKKDIAKELCDDFPDLIYKERAKVLYYQEKVPERLGKISLITAGSADIPVAEEARVTAEIRGSYIEPLYDVGIAGIHRLYLNREKFQNANAGIVIAGMEGALPSFVAGLVDYPIIAVPTSVGYGANLNGLVALLGMINSCVPGVSVVNVDNGYGAGYIASMINRKIEGRG